MRRLLLLLPALGLLTALPAEGASSTAWNTSVQCTTILGLESVSEYTEEVLLRADEALTAAHDLETDTDFRLFPWTREVRSSFAKLIDVHLRLTQQADDLKTNSACLRFDLAAIECKMDQVRNELSLQLDRGSYQAIMRLQKLLLFLNQRYAQLSSGALDPSYKDPSWSTPEIFDDPAADYTEPMCPYNSDYAPPQQNGYGCDIDVLATRTAFTPLRTEYDALRIISDQLETYRAEAAEFLEVQKSIDELFHKTSALPDPPAPRTHLRAFGCGWKGGLCSNDPTRHCQGSTDCGAGNSCLFPNKVCENNTAMVCTEDIACLTDAGANVGPCIEQTEKTAAATELRGPFSLRKKHLDLLMDFMAGRIQEGNNRLFKDSLKTVSEFDISQTAARENRSTDDPFTGSIRYATRTLYALWSRIQGQDEATIFPSATDPQLEVANTLTSLRDAVGDLARLTRMGGDRTLRGFVVKYAYFLRRSCVYRPCNASLNEILKIVFADECFPYADGSFLNDSPGDPRSTKCADAAEISVP